jgi:uncharacterized GH25 family protein
MLLRNLCTALFAIVAASVHAHDFWIEPSSFRVEPGASVSLALRVGEHFRGEPVARNSARIRRFVVSGPAGEQVVGGEDGADPAGSARLATPGLHLVAYHNSPSSITLEAAQFEPYLEEEGLERIVALRSERGESALPAREIYSRCAKALVLSGSGTTAGYDRRLGLPLELVPEADPYASRPGPLPVRILFQGRPLEGALVVALSKDEPGRKLTARSDRDGRVTFDLGGGRTWLVKAVHMLPAAKRSGADWESLWASLTFEIPARAVP